MSYITLNKKNFFHNLEICAKQANGKDNVAIVLKDNAYGHGLVEISQMAQEFGLKNAVVLTLKEALIVKDYYEDILILADTTNYSLSHSFHTTIKHLDDIDSVAKNTQVHIEIDTGMHRNGIALNELEETITRALAKDLKITGFFAHHKSADKLGSEFYWQNCVFTKLKREIISLCDKLNIKNYKLHSTNSAALFRHKNFNEDMCRVGISVYGYTGNTFPLNVPDLKPVLSLWAERLSARKLKKDQKVGYGGLFTAPRDMEVSTYDIGYGDGFKRINPKTEFKTTCGKKILGQVSMDSFSCESTEDAVCLFDNVHELAKIHKTISYEILTSLDPILRKVII